MDKKDKLSAIVFGIPALLSLCIGLVGCGHEHTVPPLERTVYYTTKGDFAYNIVVIDHCQYLQVSHGLGHKGDCTNSIHIYNNPSLGAEVIDDKKRLDEELVWLEDRIQKLDHRLTMHKLGKDNE